MNDQILPPSVDPDTRKVAVRKVHAVNEAGTRTVTQVRGYDPVIADEPDTLGGTNTGSSPLELALVSLVSCDGVIINGVAEAMNFDYARVELEASGQIDVRGAKGVSGVRPYFEKVNLGITLSTDEPDARFEQLQANVEFRCPIINLFRGAGVELNVTWRRAGPG